MIRQQKIYYPIIKEYSRLAKAYDRRWPFYIEFTAHETLKRLSLEPSDRILDIGCGTGVLLHHLSKIHPADHLFCIDPVPDMPAVAKNRLTASITLLEGWAEQLPFGSGQFDVVVSCSMFHYIREPVIALNEMRRVFRPGGLLIITDWCDDYLACRICDIFLRLFNRAYFKLFGKRGCLQLLKETGYDVAGFDLYKIKWLWGMMTVKAVKNRNSLF